MHSYYSGNHQCAAHFLHSAREMSGKGYELSKIKVATIFSALEQSFAATGMQYSAQLAASNCIPQLDRFSSAQYQHTYYTINRVVAEGWQRIGNISRLVVPGTRAENSIAPSSIWRRIATARSDSTTAAAAAAAAREGSGERNSLLTPVVETTTVLEREISAAGEAAAALAGQEQYAADIRVLPTLQIGCAWHETCVHQGWFIADAVEGISTHFVTLAYNLSMVESGSFGALYSSHTLEHLSHNNPPPSCPTFPHSDRNVTGCFSEVDTALHEWRRVLAPGGKLLLSVPDLEALSSFFSAPGATLHEKALLRNIIYGGQKNEFDFHKTGFYFEYLEELLLRQGFCNISRVPYKFDIFMDTSATTFYNDELISLNVQANVC